MWACCVGVLCVGCVVWVSCIMGFVPVVSLSTVVYSVQKLKGGRYVKYYCGL